MKNTLLTISYDGTNFSGWQRQPNQRTVQGDMEKALSCLCNQEIKINGTSRTDAGVHALGQRASFIADYGVPTQRLPKVLNGMFASETMGKARKNAGDIVVLEAQEVPLDFHARFQAVGKQYLYRLDCNETMSPFQRHYAYQIARKLDIDGMKKAALQLVGTHDFKCFQAAGGQEMESTVRTIYDAKLLEKNDRLIFRIIGDGFLYNMVRIMIGTLVDIGLGKKNHQDMMTIIQSKDRTQAGHTAPPQGLYLKEVYYDQQQIAKELIK